MSTDFEKDVNAYYQAKESYTKLLLDPSTHKTSDVDKKKNRNPMTHFDGFQGWLQREETKPTESTSKVDFEALFEGKSIAEIQSAMDSTRKGNSTAKKPLPIMKKR